MQELEKILEEIEENKHIIEIFGRGVYFVPLEATKQIIRKHMTDGWISGKVKPTEDGFYVATMSGELVDQEEPFVGLAEFEDGNWVDGEDVIAWQPLPEPYRPERQKNDYKGEQK